MIGAFNCVHSETEAVSMSDNWRFTLSWKRTWSDRLDDLVGRDCTDPRCIAYVRRDRGLADPKRAWRWSVSAGDQPVASGHTADGPRLAVRAAEAAWAEWKGST